MKGVRVTIFHSGKCRLVVTSTSSSLYEKIGSILIYLYLQETGYYLFSPQKCLGNTLTTRLTVSEKLKNIAANENV